MATATDDDAGSSAKETINAMGEDNKSALKSWYFFDWANQAYALTVMTVIAPALMANLYNTATGTQGGAGFYAWVLTISMIFVVVTAPALGVIADKMPIKKKLLKWYTLVGILFTALMGAAPYFGSQGYIILALMYTIGTIGFTGGNTIYYSFMPYLAPKKMSRSCFNMGLCLWVHWRFIDSYFPPNCLTRIFLGYQFQNGNNFCYFCNMVVGIRFLDVQVKTPEPEIPSTMEWKGFKDSTKVAYKQVFQTFREIKRFKVLAFFLFAYLLFYDGVNTIAMVWQVHLVNLF